MSPPLLSLDSVILFAGQFQDESSGWETFARLGPGNEMLGAKMLGSKGQYIQVRSKEPLKSVE